jgi:hypothetical protein
VVFATFGEKFDVVFATFGICNMLFYLVNFFGGEELFLVEKKREKVEKVEEL